jgi:hypothetical protein
MKTNRCWLVSFIATLLIGVDVIQIFGVRISLVPLFFYGVYIVYKNKSVDVWFLYVFFFSVACIPSVFFSHNPEKSIGYLFWIIFNYFSISVVYKHLVVTNRSEAIFGIRDSYRFQIVIGGVLYFSGMQFRAQVLYYEPSYFAIALIPFIVIVFCDLLKNGIKQESSTKNTSYIDLILLLVALYTTKSANMILVGMLTAIIVSLYGEGKIKKIIIMFLLFIASWLLLSWYSNNYNDLLSTTFQKIANADSFFDAILERTGNRWPRAQLTFDTAMHTFWGVGIGAFKEFTSDNYFPKFVEIPAYYSPLANEAVNIYFEIAASCGWIALAIWLFFHFNMLKKISSDERNARILVCSLIVAMLALFIESNFLRPYYWMLIGMVMGQVSLSKNIRSD